MICGGMFIHKTDFKTYLNEYIVFFLGDRYVFSSYKMIITTVMSVLKNTETGSAQLPCLINSS